MAQALWLSLGKPFECAVGFFFGNTELNLELWTAVDEITGLDIVSGLP